MKRDPIRPLGIALFLLVSTFLVYSPALHGDFLWDDDAHVSHNSALTSLSGLKDIWLKPGAVQQYYPVTYTAFWIQYHLWGLDPFGYHVVNVVLHALNAVLLWMLLESLGLSGAWIAAWLFALHPVAGESVAWISELKNVLSTFFYLAAAFFLIRSERGVRGRTRGYGAAFLLFVGALLSKSVTTTLPISFFLLYFWQTGRFSKEPLLRLLPFLVAGL